MMERAKKVNILRIDSEKKNTVDDKIIREVPFTIILNGKELVTLLATPEKLEYLAAGYLFSEGIIKTKDEIKNINLGKNGYYANVELVKDFKIPDDFFQKRLIGSGCGESVSLYDSKDVEKCKPVDSNIQISCEQIINLMKEFQNKSILFKETGGVHSSAICNSDSIEIFAEDIGRHNAVDKVIGECLLKSIPTENKIILTSGRISSEILIKVIKHKTPIIISRSAPTDLAVGLAEKMKVTLIGFARGSRMNVYTHNFRVT